MGAGLMFRWLNREEYRALAHSIYLLDASIISTTHYISVYSVTCWILQVALMVVAVPSTGSPKVNFLSPQQAPLPLHNHTI